MAGNFNLVNTDELFALLDKHPTTTIRESDLGAMIETVHYYLREATETPHETLNLRGVLKQAASHFDGGYVCSGLVGDIHARQLAMSTCRRAALGLRQEALHGQQPARVYEKFIAGAVGGGHDALLWLDRKELRQLWPSSLARRA